MFFKLYSLKFAIAPAQKKMFCFKKLVITTLFKNDFLNLEHGVLLSQEHHIMFRTSGGAILHHSVLLLASMILSHLIERLKFEN